MNQEVNNCFNCPLCNIENNIVYCEHPKNDSKIITDKFVDVPTGKDFLRLIESHKQQLIAPKWCPLKRESLTLYFKDEKSK